MSASRIEQNGGKAGFKTSGSRITSLLTGDLA